MLCSIFVMIQGAATIAPVKVIVPDASCFTPLSLEAYDVKLEIKAIKENAVTTIFLLSSPQEFLR